MFDFAYPIHLYLLATLVIFALLFWWAQISRSRKLRRFGKLVVIGNLMPDASIYKPRIKIVLELLALAAIVIVLARPRYGEKETQQSRQAGIEIMIAFDVSNSMLASSNDDPNGISRLDRARLVLENLSTNCTMIRSGLSFLPARPRRKCRSPQIIIPLKCISATCRRVWCNSKARLSPML